ncbi:cobalamin-binding protein [Shewanella sp. KT0246]|uniref:cobalamin-binding protein n=1 Tax=Shewanella sp. KT0246 TaxID=2815912 RepID=UPI001BC6DBC8|nr:cobalamin-binding protein [Shewanella sp. KT0246]GIU48486.1 cobalamin-binding protein [Shewanella sp. KT0246]
MTLFSKLLNHIVFAVLTLFTSNMVNAAEMAPSKTEQRYVVLSPHAVEMLFDIGAGDTIIGTVEYADYPEAANKIRRIGRYDYVNYEALLSLNPDAIIVNSQSTSSGILERLSDLGFPVIDTSVEKLTDIPKRLNELGELTGNQYKANQQAQEFSHLLAEIRNEFQHQTPVNVFYQVWPNPLTTTSSQWMNEIFAGCGGVNVFYGSHSDYPQVSIEQVVTTMPDIILKPIYHGNSNQEVVSWETWKELPAVINQQVKSLEGDLIHRTGPRVLQGMINVCRNIDNARQYQASAHD